MRWIIKNTKEHTYWRMQGSLDENIGVLGEWVPLRAQATRYTDERRLQHIADKGALPEDFEWECEAVRHKNALDIQNAVNPAGIANALREAFREVIAERGDTKALRTDPACRLILHQLCYVMEATTPYSFVQYGEDLAACREVVKAMEDNA